MDRERRELIVREIEYWRRNRLLPEQYCDFLLNLYTESAEATEAKPVRKPGIQSAANAMLWILLSGIAACIFYVVLHFSSFGTQLQIALLALASAVPYIAGTVYRKRKPLPANGAVALGTAFMLAGGAFLLNDLGLRDWQYIAVFLAGCSFLWLGYGIVFRLTWLHFCGWVGMILSYAVVFNRWFVPEHWFELELAWLPLSLLIGCLGWFMRRQAKSTGAVIFIIACLLWIIPELYAALLTDWPIAVTQVLLMGKLTILAALAYALRKIWIEWVV